MKVLTCLYVNYYTVKHAPKAWLKYMLYCFKHCKHPNVNMLAKIVTIAKIAKRFKKTETKTPEKIEKIEWHLNTST